MSISPKQTKGASTSVSKPEKSVDQRIQAAFTDVNSSAYLDTYLETLRDNIRSIETTMARSTFSCIFLVSIFELITRASISEVTLGPFKIQDLSIIQKTIPFIITYLYFNVATLIRYRNKLSGLHMYIFKHFYKSIYENGLEDYLVPVSSGIMTVESHHKNKTINNLQMILVIPGVIIIYLGIVLFDIYAFYRLFIIFGITDVIVWAALTASLVFVLQAYIAWIDNHEP